MTPLAVAQLGAGLLASLAGWTMLRRNARTRASSLAALIVDATPPLLGWSVFLAVTARPVLAGLMVLALAIGLVIIDTTKREVLREPVVFTDMSEFTSLFAHPELYIPFAGPLLVYGGAVAIFAVLGAILHVEPPLWTGVVWPAALGVGGVIALTVVLATPPMLGRAASWLRRLGPSGDPIGDASAIGPLVSLFVHGIVARAERRQRRAAVRPAKLAPVVVQSRANLPVVVIVQGESFIDARRLHPGIAAELLPNYDRCRAEAMLAGRLSVPGWGANTVRTEFAMLTGLRDEAIGFDRFNPYHAFARVPVASLAWQLRSEGYRTLCLHPFDRKFYRRDAVLPNLGFDEFHGIEAFADAERINGWVADAALTRRIVEHVERDGAGLLLFAITIENHGPWDANAPPADGAALAPGLPADARYNRLRHYLAGVRSADRMLGDVAAALKARDKPGVLAFYGDHVPSIPDSFAEFDYHDTRTDYLIWRARGRPETARDIAAHELGGLIAAAVGAEKAVASEAVRCPPAPAA